MFPFFILDFISILNLRSSGQKSFCALTKPSDIARRGANGDIIEDVIEPFFTQRWQSAVNRDCSKIC
jgi:hypothetical protein